MNDWRNEVTDSLSDSRLLEHLTVKQQVHLFPTVMEPEGLSPIARLILSCLISQA
jgi:hypothetical protein